MLEFVISYFYISSKDYIFTFLIVYSRIQYIFLIVNKYLSYV